MANPLVCIFNPITTLIDQVQSTSTGPAAIGIPVVTNLSGLLDASLLGIGSLATAGETISAGQLVNLYSASGTLHAEVASAQNTGTSPSGQPYPIQAQGFANTGTVLGGVFTVNFTGIFKYIDSNSEFGISDIGSTVYLSAVTPGGITKTPPASLKEAVGYVVAFTAPSTVIVNFIAAVESFATLSGVCAVNQGGTGATTANQALINLGMGTAYAQNTFYASPTSGSGALTVRAFTLGDIPQAGATTGQGIVWNGTAWAPGDDKTPFTDITTGTNTTATMTVGGGASIVVSGGSVEATQIQNVVVSAVAPSAGQALVATSGVLASWQNVATIGSASDHPGQTMTLGPVNLVASVPATGHYRVSFYEDCTVAGNSGLGTPFGSGVFGGGVFDANDDQLQTTITWTDDVQARTAFPCPPLDLAETNAASGDIFIRAVSGSAITFTSTLVATGTPTYGVFVRIESLL